MKEPNGIVTESNYRIFVKITDSTSCSYEAIKKLANKFADYLKDQFELELCDIDTDKNWFVGMVCTDKYQLEEMRSILKRWVGDMGLNAFLYVDDFFDGCCHNCGYCGDCQYSENGETCRLYYGYA